MKRKRRTFTAEVKAKIALEAMKGEKTINEIAPLYEVYPNQVSQWKGEGYRKCGLRLPQGPARLRLGRVLRTQAPAVELDLPCR